MSSRWRTIGISSDCSAKAVLLTDGDSCRLVG
jgi:hypothetical protein